MMAVIGRVGLDEEVVVGMVPSALEFVCVGTVYFYVRGV